jgi:hypothetical protein
VACKNQSQGIFFCFFAAEADALFFTEDGVSWYAPGDETAGDTLRLFVGRLEAKLGS